VAPLGVDGFLLQRRRHPPTLHLSLPNEHVVAAVARGRLQRRFRLPPRPRRRQTQDDVRFRRILGQRPEPYTSKLL